MDSKPLVTINILSYNRKETLKQILSKVYAQHYQNIEVIVVDNGSNDGSKEMVFNDFPMSKVIRLEKNVGVSGWNKGIKEAKGSFILCLDDDAFLNVDALEIMIEKSVNNRIDILYPIIYAPDELFCFNDYYNSGLLSFWGCCVLISKKTIDMLTGFDPNIFIYSHELEFTIRALGAGLTIGFVPEAKAFHLKTIDPDKIDFQKFMVILCNLLYIVNKLFNGSIRLKINCNLIIRYLRMTVRKPALIVKIKEVIDAVRLGKKNTMPLDRNVQNMYQSNFFEFVNPITIKYKYGGIESFVHSKPFFYPRNFSTLNKRELV